MSYSKPRGGISKNVIVLGLASFFTDISSEMLYPIVPVFLTSVLGSPISILGLIEGIAESTASILKAVSGLFSDRIGRRRPFVLSGYVLSSLAKPLMFLAYSWPVVLVSRFFDRLGKGLRTSPRDAIIADSSETAFRGKAFGFHRALDGLGACIGPLIAIWCLTALKDDLRVVFLIAFIPAAIAILVLAYFLKEAKPAVRNDQQEKRDHISWDLRRYPRSFKACLIISAVFAAGNSSDAFLIMRSKDIGLSMAAVIGAYVLYNVSRTFLSTSAGSLSDRIPRNIVLAAGYIIFAVVYLGFGFIKPGIMPWILFAVYGFYMAMTDGVGKALVSDMVAVEQRGTALGLYHFVLGIFAFFASLIAGLLWTYAGAAAPFIYGSAMALVSGIAFIFIHAWDRVPETDR